MFYDHFLAKDWKKYSELSLTEFTRNAYGILLKNYTVLPARTRRILPFMIYNNWLKNYSNFDELQRNFEGMSRRTTFDSKMEFVVEDLKKDYDFFQVDFNDFFPHLMRFSKDYIQKNCL